MNLGHIAAAQCTHGEHCTQDGPFSGSDGVAAARHQHACEVNTVKKNTAARLDEYLYQRITR